MGFGPMYVTLRGLCVKPLHQQTNYKCIFILTRLIYLIQYQNKKGQDTCPIFQTLLMNLYYLLLFSLVILYLL